MTEELKVIISAEVNKLKQGVADAKRHINSFKEQVKKAEKDVDKHMKAIGDSVKTAALTMGAALGAAALALIALAGGTEEYRNQQAQLITAFEAAGVSAGVATETYNGLYRVLGDSGQAQEAAQHLAKLTSEEQALNEWTTICQGVYATFGASLPIESLTEAANETAKTGELTGALADALNWAGIHEDTFKEQLAECNTEAEREALIRETLNGLYGDAAAMYETNNATILAQRDAQAALQGQLALLGEAMAPITTAFTQFGTEVLTVITPYLQELAAAVLPTLQSALSTVSETLGTVIGYLVNNWGTILAIAGVIGGITLAIGLYNAVAAIKAAMAAAEVTTVGALTTAYAAQAVAVMGALLPYVLIVAAIAAVIAIIVLCVQNWDTIKAKVIEVAENVKATVEEWVAVIGEKIKAMVDAVVGFFTDLGTKIGTAVEGIKTSVVNTFNTVKETVSTAAGAAKDAAEKGLTEMKAAYEREGGGIKGIASATMEGVKTYFNTGFTFLNSLTGGKLGEIANTFKTKFEAVKTTVSTIFNNIKTTISNAIEAAKTKVSNVINAIKGFFNFEFQWPSIPMPHFGISPAGWQIGDLLQGSIPYLSVEWYATGGVFDTPTLFAYGNGSLGGLGENGAEAVVPLENNLGWLDKLATMLNDRLGTNANITLNVDGRVFAETAVDSINQLTRQKGKLGLNLV